MLVYIVKYYGCNIKDDDSVAWLPETTLFATYEEAYKSYLYVTNIFQKHYDESTKKTYTFTIFWYFFWKIKIVTE